LAGKDVSVVEKFLHGAGPDHPALPEGCIVGMVGPSHCPGVGGNRAGPGFSPSGFENNNGFFPRHLAGYFHEPRAILDSFEVGYDHPGFRILGESPEKIAFVEDSLVSQGNKMRKPEFFFPGPVQNRGAKCPGLGDEGDVSREGPPGSEGCIQPCSSGDDPQNIGSQYVQSVLLRHPHEFLLPFRPFYTALFESGADNHRVLYPFFAAFPQDLRYPIGRNHDDR
jgi:hypothetical protein